MKYEYNNTYSLDEIFVDLENKGICEILSLEVTSEGVVVIC